MLLERADEMGGTWRDNTYPGCRCDVPSHLYSFSFAPNPNWSSTFSPQPEILEYLRGVAARFGVLPHVRFGTELESPSGTRPRRAGASRPRRARSRADVLIAAQGPLCDPLVPDLPGLDSFEGTTFHSAAWDHDHRLEGERVAVIGTGRLGDPVRAARSSRSSARCTSSSARRRGYAAPEPADEGLGAAALRAPARGAAGHARRHLLGARDVRAPVPQPAHAQARHADGAAPARAAGAGPGAARAS